MLWLQINEEEEDDIENNIWMFKGHVYQETEIFLQDGICIEQVIT